MGDKTLDLQKMNRRRCVKSLSLAVILSGCLHTNSDTDDRDDEDGEDTETVEPSIQEVVVYFVVAELPENVEVTSVVDIESDVVKGIVEEADNYVRDYENRDRLIEASEETDQGAVHVPAAGGTLDEEKYHEIQEALDNLPRSDPEEDGHQVRTTLEGPLVESGEDYVYVIAY